MPRGAWKKCACFTPDGVVYTRLEADDFDGQRFLFGRESRFAGPYGQVQAIAPRRGELLIWREFIELPMYEGRRSFGSIELGAFLYFGSCEYSRGLVG